eukprot:c43313_g1_i1 orf=3-1088(-)
MDRHLDRREIPAQEVESGEVTPDALCSLDTSLNAELPTFDSVYFTRSNEGWEMGGGRRKAAIYKTYHLWKGMGNSWRGLMASDTRLQKSRYMGQSMRDPPTFATTNEDEYLQEGFTRRDTSSVDTFQREERRKEFERHTVRGDLLLDRALTIGDTRHNTHEVGFSRSAAARDPDMRTSVTNLCCNQEIGIATNRKVNREKRFHRRNRHFLSSAERNNYNLLGARETHKSCAGNQSEKHVLTTEQRRSTPTKAGEVVTLLPGDRQREKAAREEDNKRETKSKSLKNNSTSTVLQLRENEQWSEYVSKGYKPRHSRKSARAGATAMRERQSICSVEEDGITQISDDDRECHGEENLRKKKRKKK